MQFHLDIDLRDGKILVLRNKCYSEAVIVRINMR